ncbi:hypothetical protein JZO70_07300 [Enterococcus sp. 669A]|uniref:DUF3899 domain-containing protein n=1 Tax=Candidatus Enterococcus moelleringii TaxID=2815325 RepID=A0ABS3L8M9_9ENTE|nr:hypothetical protein [Enterococcus sp. 669A]MBO1305960.1 hypothetical protein [Enterococcus sp. 669A]
MSNTTLVLFLCVGIILISSSFMCYYVYSLVLIDAKARGLERPKLWALLSAGGQSGQGMLLYLIKRRKYDVQLKPSQQAEMDQLKRKIVALILISTVAIVFFVFTVLPIMF